MALAEAPRNAAIGSAASVWQSPCHTILIVMRTTDRVNRTHGLAAYLHAASKPDDASLPMQNCSMAMRARASRAMQALSPRTGLGFREWGETPACTAQAASCQTPRSLHKT